MIVVSEQYLITAWLGRLSAIADACYGHLPTQLYHFGWNDANLSLEYKHTS